MPHVWCYDGLLSVRKFVVFHTLIITVLLGSLEYGWCIYILFVHFAGCMYTYINIIYYDWWLYRNMLLTYRPDSYCIGVFFSTRRLGDIVFQDRATVDQFVNRCLTAAAPKQIPKTDPNRVVCWGIIKLNVWYGHQTMQIYGNFEGFGPWVGLIISWTPCCLHFLWLESLASFPKMYKKRPRWYAKPWISLV